MTAPGAGVDTVVLCAGVMDLVVDIVNKVVILIYINLNIKNILF
jgi:hypothetical protein